jgi:hypothetical protein
MSIPPEPVQGLIEARKHENRLQREAASHITAALIEVRNVSDPAVAVALYYETLDALQAKSDKRMKERENPPGTATQNR